MLERTISSGVTSRCRGGPSGSSIVSSRSFSPRCPISPKSWRIVVSGGVKYGASGTSSNPTTLTSPGSAAGLVQRPQDAERHLVVGDEHRGQVRHRRPASARSRSPSAGSSRRPGAPGTRDAGGLERGAPAGDPLLRLEPVARPRDVPRRLRWPSVEQMRGRRRGARELVDRGDRDDVRRVRPRARPAAPGRDAQQRARRRLLRGDHQDAVDAEVRSRSTASRTDSRSNAFRLAIVMK